MQARDLFLAELLLAEPEIAAWLEPDERRPADQDDEPDRESRG